MQAGANTSRRFKASLEGVLEAGAPLASLCILTAVGALSEEDSARLCALGYAE